MTTIIFSGLQVKIKFRRLSCRLLIVFRKNWTCFPQIEHDLILHFGFLKSFQVFFLSGFFFCLLACTSVFMLYRKWCEALLCLCKNNQKNIKMNLAADSIGFPPQFELSLLVKFLQFFLCSRRKVSR